MNMFGINCVLHNTTVEQVKTILPHIVSSGATWIRWEFDILHHYTDQDRDHLDKILSLISTSNIQILGVILPQIPGTIKSLLGIQKYGMSVLDSMDFIVQNTASIVTKFGQHITHRQLRNEANTTRFWLGHPNPQGYVELIKVLAHTIKATQSNSTIIAGGVYSGKYDYLSSYYPNFMEECIGLGLDKYIDIYAYHPYHLGCYIGLQTKEQILSQTSDLISTFYNTFVQHTNKKLRITEFGISDKLTRVSQSDIGWIYTQLIKQYPQIMIFLRNICDYNDTRHSPLNPERYFGLLDSNFHPKATLHSLTKNLQSAHIT